MHSAPIDRSRSRRSPGATSSPLARRLSAGLAAGLLALAVAPVAAAQTREAPKREPVVISAEFSAEWFWGDAGVRRKHLMLCGKPAPEIALKDWRGEPQEIAKLTGKVVVVDFWATWCSPCMRAMPENVELVKTFGKDGLVFIGIHDHVRGLPSLDAALKANNINYPVGVDDAGKSQKAYQVQFWPTYAVIDRKGVLRAVGLKPQYLKQVVEKLLAEPAPAAPAAPPPSDQKPATPPPAEAPPAAPPKSDATTSSNAPLSPDWQSGFFAASPADFPADGPAESGKPAPAESTPAVVPGVIKPEWLEGNETQRKALAPLAALAAPPALPTGTTWINSQPLELASLRGKVVVLDFWATWCGPCIASIPKNNEIAAKYADQGLVLIGVCHARGVEKMADMVKSKSIAYPVIADAASNATSTAYKVNGYPDYHVIDRAGKLRALDVRNDRVEEVVKALLAEPAPAAK